MSERITTVLRLVAWLATAAMGVLALTQMFGVTGIPVVYAAQALTIPLLLPSIAIATVALWRGRRGARLLGGLNLGIVVALVVLVAPVVPPILGQRPLPAAAGTTFSVTNANVYFENSTPDRAADAVLATAADVLVIVEYSEPTRVALTAQGADERYPYRAGTPSDRRNGVAIYSRFPIASGGVEPVGSQDGINVTLDVRGTPVRVLVVHPLPGVSRGDVRQLARDLDTIGDVGRRGDVPTVVIGDFNGSRWHPAFRRLLAHFTDVHEALGDGLSTSWPMNLPGPSFVRLDHALVSGRMTATRIDDYDIPGSDHRGFVVQLGLAAESRDSSDR